MDIFWWILIIAIIAGNVFAVAHTFHMEQSEKQYDNLQRNIYIHNC